VSFSAGGGSTFGRRTKSPAVTGGRSGEISTNWIFLDFTPLTLLGMIKNSSATSTCAGMTD